MVHQDLYDDSGQHLAEYALNPNCNLGSGASWLGPAGTEGAKFELDYGEGAMVEADGFYLRNSKIDGRQARQMQISWNFKENSLTCWHLRSLGATAQFRVEVSLDRQEWKTALESSLPVPDPPAAGSDCHPTIFFPSSDQDEEPLLFRYLRFTALTFSAGGGGAGGGAGLSFISPRQIGTRKARFA